VKLRAKILTGFIFITIILSTAGIIALYELNMLSSSVKSLISNNYKSIEASEKMIDALEKQDQGILLILNGKVEKGRLVLENANSLFIDALSVAQKSISLFDEESYINDIKERYRKFRDNWAKAYSLSGTDNSMQWYVYKHRKLLVGLHTSVRELSQLNNEVLYKTATQIESRAQRAITPSIIAFSAAIIFVFIFNYFINLYFVKPLIKITKGIENTIKFQTPFNVEIETKDELLYLRNAIQNYVSIQKTLGKT
jgi:methyl-accepting chemotaxis protein